ncbi:MAG: YbaN family protein [Planctomycetota bacterium]
MTGLKRWIVAGTGVLLVGIGALGAVLPGLPTTVFLLGATWCFARSCPWLEERLLRNRLFAPYMRVIDGEVPMTTRARITVIAIIWATVSISMATFYARDALGSWVAATLVFAALVGSVVVWRFRRDLQPAVVPVLEEERAPTAPLNSPARPPAGQSSRRSPDPAPSRSRSSRADRRRSA